MKFLNNGIRRTARCAARRTAIALGVLAGVLGGCSSYVGKQAVVEIANEGKKGPEIPPYQTITNFSDALRCMDNMLITYGIRDVSVITEELDDKTKKVSAGTKDMLISAVSNMTRRSRAVRLITFGADSRSLDEWNRRGGRLEAYAQVPQFQVRGSVSQFDQTLGRGEADAGLSYKREYNVGWAQNASVSRMAVDLNMAFANNFAIVPGVTSQNSILILSHGSGFDADATIRKFGINFSMSLARAEGQAQGLRNLIDLAAIELFGRLTRTPYWTCLGSNPDDPEVKKEIEDWFQGMSTVGDLIPYVQYQLRNRGYYAGPIDRKMNEALAAGIAQYRAALGLAAKPEIDVAFLAAYLNADHAAVLAKNPAPQPAANTRPEEAPAAGNGAGERAATAAAPRREPIADGGTGEEATRERAAGPAPAVAAARALQIALQSADNLKSFRRGQSYQLAVGANKDAHIYCYLRDEGKQVQRIFPNRFSRETLVRMEEPLALPGNMRFQLVANQRGLTEAVVCYATERDIFAQLPKKVVGNDFESLPVGSLDEVKQAIRSVTNNNFAEGVFYVRVQ